MLGIVVALVALVWAGIGGFWSGSSKASFPAAQTQFVWVTKPETFQKNTDTTFVVELQLYVSAGANQGWQPNKDQPTFVGVVTPPSVSIQSINGAAPADTADIPGKGRAFKTTSDPASGRIQIVLRGTEPTDGKLQVFYQRSADWTRFSEGEAVFSVTE